MIGSGALYAASLEHDENEKFLDRSFFGRHKRSEGRFGGAPMDDPDQWTMHGMGDEMLAMGALAPGLSGEISNWGDNIFQRDVIHARILDHLTVGVWLERGTG